MLFILERDAAFGVPLAGVTQLHSLTENNPVLLLHSLFVLGWIGAGPSQ